MSDFVAATKCVVYFCCCHEVCRGFYVAATKCVVDFLLLPRSVTWTFCCTYSKSTVYRVTFSEVDVFIEEKVEVGVFYKRITNEGNRTEYCRWS